MNSRLYSLTYLAVHMRAHAKIVTYCINNISGEKTIKVDEIDQKTKYPDKSYFGVCEWIWNVLLLAV